MDLKTILGIIAVVIGFIGYVPYIIDTIRNKTKPHAFSWLVWTILTVIAFFAQLSRGAGVGAWATGMTALVCAFITILAFRQGEKDIKIFDWVSLLVAGVSLILWGITNNPLVAIILVVIIDAAGFFPTFRKAFHKPFEETMSQYIIATIKWVLSIVALGSLNLTTVLFPAAVAALNTSFSIMLIIRRRKFKPRHQ